jgi:hypothetical protein
LDDLFQILILTEYQGDIELFRARTTNQIERERTAALGNKMASARPRYFGSCNTRRPALSWGFP